MTCSFALRLWLASLLLSAIDVAAQRPPDNRGKEGQPKQPANGPPKDNPPKGGIPKEGMPKGGFPKEPFPKEPFPKGGFPKEPFPKEPFPKEPFPKGGFPKEPFPREPFPKEPFPKGGFPKEPFPKGPFPKEPFPKGGGPIGGAGGAGGPPPIDIGPLPLCPNSALDRRCWGQYNINTDYYKVTPDTKATRTYNLELSQATLAPDGVPRFMQVVNGKYPGPTLEANWGDTFVVNVVNNIPNNGTAIHFHGVRQLNTFQQDGAPGVTQCPVAPTKNLTYTWRAHQYGTSWYHSHWSLQAWEGILGPIVIHGPASGNYDEDLGPLFITDWSHATPDQLWDQAQTTGPPPMDNGLINGTNTYNGTTGRRFERTFVKGRKYLIRVISSAIDTHWKFSIDNHNLTVIATDFVPIQPYTTNNVRIGIAQRYDIIVEATDPLNTGKYWLRAVPQLTCSNAANPDDIKGIIRYGANVGDPTTTAYNLTDDCLNEPLEKQHPVLQKTVGPPTANIDELITLGKPNGVFRWFLNGTSFLANWSQPTILSINNNLPYTNQSNVIEVNGNNDSWVYFVIESAIGVTHPIHLHGHDFWVLANGTGAYNSSIPLNTNNPPRRDVQMLPASGFLVIAFPTDNPGAWLLHCHIGWHQSEGLVLQFVENKSRIKPLINQASMNEVCNNWNAYFTTNPVQYDSGVRMVGGMNLDRMVSMHHMK